MAGAIIVIASGPSLTRTDCIAAARSPYQTLAVSDAYRWINADYHYACDPAWWAIHSNKVKAGRKFTQYGGADEKAAAEAMGLEPIIGVDKPGLGLDCLHFNGTSGAQAVNLAYLLQAELIVLLGFDMQWTDGKSHFFGDHPAGLRNKNPEPLVVRMDQLAKDLAWEGVEVINCSRDTALYQFPCVRFDDFLKGEAWR